MDTERMTQKKAIIIGATSGIGLEMVKVLTSQGWQVGIAGRRQALLQQIQSKNLDVIATECIDITQEDAPRRLLSLIGKTGGMDLYFTAQASAIRIQLLTLKRRWPLSPPTWQVSPRWLAQPSTTSSSILRERGTSLSSAA